jgi:hypothetical protein
MKTSKPNKTNIEVDNSREGVSIEKEIVILLNNGGTKSGEAPLIYTEKKEGTLPAYNIRSDRFEIALDAVDKMNKSYTARRQDNLKIVKNDDNIEGLESIQGTNN